MSAETRDVTAEYRLAESKAEQFNPGQQVDIAKLMRSAFMHGYAQCLLEHNIRIPVCTGPDSHYGNAQ